MLCQLKSYFGTLRIVSLLPSGWMTRYSKLFPRKCMWGITLRMRISVGNEYAISSLWFGSFAGILIDRFAMTFVLATYFGGRFENIIAIDERSCSTLPVGV